MLQLVWWSTPEVIMAIANGRAKRTNSAECTRGYRGPHPHGNRRSGNKQCTTCTSRQEQVNLVKNHQASDFTKHEFSSAYSEVLSIDHSTCRVWPNPVGRWTIETSHTSACTIMCPTLANGHGPTCTNQPASADRDMDSDLNDL
jgi:hypothetical protein